VKTKCDHPDCAKPAEKSVTLAADDGETQTMNLCLEHLTVPGCKAVLQARGIA
jgi:hypothetical protein